MLNVEIVGVMILAAFILLILCAWIMYDDVLIAHSGSIRIVPLQGSA